MIKIVSLDIVDLLPFSSGILFVYKEKNANGKDELSFYTFDATTKSIAAVTKNAYLLAKFGDAFADISARLEDVFSCDTSVLWNGQLFVNYSSGEFGLFDEYGKLLNTGDVSYHGSPARDAAADELFIWSAVPEKNLIVKFSPSKNRIVMRIGGGTNSPFASPCSVEQYEDYIYICNPDTMKINRMNINDYSVEDYKHFDEPIYKYINYDEKEYVVLASGVYML